MVIYSLGNVLTSSYAKKVFWTIRDNYRRTQVYYTPYLSRLFCEFHEPENVMCWHYVKWHIEKKTNFFLNIYGWFKFYSQRVRRSRSFLCLFFVLTVFLRKILHVSNYDRYRVQHLSKLQFTNLIVRCNDLELCR